jgi:3alpha(or 20beta)-hydroxysteroid dehydrogenase
VFRPAQPLTADPWLDESSTRTRRRAGLVPTTTTDQETTMANWTADDLPDLTGRTVLVTGAGGGLGLITARELGRAGARVVLGVRHVAKAAEAISGMAGSFDVRHLDVADLASVRRFTASWTGGLDILVNNAGIEITNLLTEVTADEIRKMLDVNILGTTLGVKWGLRTMRPDGLAGQGGAIINVASVAATIAFPGIAVYSATKSAVDRLTRVAAMESGKLGYGVRVNCIYPGLVPTAMGAGLANDVAQIGLFGSPEEAVGAVIELTPSGRLGEVSDMADAVVFLASDASRFVNGVGLPVDGGMGM